ncbi:MAG: hypothetical protein ACRDVM_03485 [Acidimicrobiia bacterium]
MPAPQAHVFDLILIGANPAGLGMAGQAQQGGLRRVLVLERGDHALPGSAVGRFGLAVRLQAPVTSIGHLGQERWVVETPIESFAARACVVAQRPPTPVTPPDFSLPPSLHDRVHFGSGQSVPARTDVLVVGPGEEAAEVAQRLVEQSDGVVLCLTGPMNRVSSLSREELLRLEAERRLTGLWHSRPIAVEDVGGFPMVFFDDRQTPDLQFDHVVFALGGELPPDPLGALGISAPGVEGVALLADGSGRSGGIDLYPVAAGWETVRAGSFPHLPAPRQAAAAQVATDRVEELRVRHYNAAITLFDTAHSDLWVLRVRPDTGDSSHLPGQYATLALGYWEPRMDDTVEHLRAGRDEQLIRRSYSISSRIFDEHGYLIDPHDEEELEFYVVLVRPSGDRIPALTPRLAGKQAGDRIHLGAKVAGRYTLAKVTDPWATMVFLATGTGEAPHNAMITQLFRRGHQGRILSAVSVRYAADLGYLAQHRLLEERYPTYRYLPLTTREGDGPRLHLQEAIEGGLIEERLDAPLDPATTHVYLCGNPAMIGLPTWEGDNAVFPERRGAAEVLLRRGFALDRRGVEGNVHYEEYW